MGLDYSNKILFDYIFSYILVAINENERVIDKQDRNVINILERESISSERDGPKNVIKCTSINFIEISSGSLKGASMTDL